ncbi:hypothetical protein LR48_Vigan09g042900 [Vigna angularis]|uniref:Protein kinase domain-containing protein n=1 Tax=Phaseolus angularis TaxID=3914 RepID=A0A0L9V9J8_PHAAN|nr:hypothetical protein LR48_Vigan09g042900 [Vigna angularis]
MSWLSLTHSPSKILWIILPQVASPGKNRDDNSAAVVAAVSARNKAEVNGGGAAKKLVFFGNVARAFDLEDLLMASTKVLGKGTFGTEYKAVLEGRAVKRLKDVTIFEKEFKEKIKGEGGREREGEKLEKN